MQLSVSGRGSVSFTPSDYALGDTVILTATPARWFAFSRWADGSALNPRPITIGRTNRHTAIFTNTVPLEPFAQREWETALGGIGEEIACDGLLTTSDGGFLVLATSASDVSGNKETPGFGGRDLWLVKLDANGAKLWERVFGGSEDDEAVGLIALPNGSYVLGGRSQSGTDGNKSAIQYGALDFWFIAIDDRGQVLWQRTFGSALEDTLTALRACADGGFVALGSSVSGPSGNKTSPNFGHLDVWVLKLDDQGNKVWDISVGGPEDDQVFGGVQETSDGGLLVSGGSASGVGGAKTAPGFGDLDYWTVRLDAQGEIVWQRDDGGNVDDVPLALAQTVDGGSLVAGWSLGGHGGNRTSESQGAVDGWIVKLNGAGEKLWEQNYGGTKYDAFSDGVPTWDNGVLLAGSSDSPGDGNKWNDTFGGLDAWLMKVDGQGNRQWEWSLGGTDSDEFGGLCRIGDDGFLVAITSQSGDNGNKTTPTFGGGDLWLVKISTYDLPPGLPRVYVDGHRHLGGTAEYFRTNSVEVAIQSSFENANIFYTLDGSPPDAGSEPYVGPFQVSPQLQPVVVRALAFDQTYSDSWEADPVTIVVHGYGVATSVVGQGSIRLTPEPPVVRYTEVEARAVPAEGWAFDHWSGALSGTEPVQALSVESDLTLQAHFIPVYPLILTVQGQGNVFVDPPVGPYRSNTLVTLTAQSVPGWVFASWSGAIDSTGNPATLTLREPRSVHAVFVREYTLSLGTDGGGTVSADPPDPALAAGTRATLTATPLAGWTFLGWQGDVIDVANPTTLTVDRDLSIRAVFGTGLTTVTNPAGFGAILREPVVGPYPYGSVVQLSAVPVVGKFFNTWGGASAGLSNSPLRFVVTNANPSVTAVFGTLATNRLTLTTLVSGQGTVTKTPPQSWYSNGVSVIVTALPDSGRDFLGWAGDATGTNNPLTVVMNGNKTITANFSGLAPSIVTAPHSQAVEAGNDAAFTVSVSGTAPLDYQWYRNGVAIPQATTESLLLTNVSFTSEGNYAVLVSNSAGSALSTPPAFLRVNQEYTFITLAGLAGNPGSADGTGGNARFNLPQGVAADTAGNAYVADYRNDTIRKVSAAGEVTTMAGLAGSRGATDGPGSAARFYAPLGIATDSAGNVYVADSGNHTVRKVSAAGDVTTLAGLAGTPGSADGTVSEASFYSPTSVAVDNARNVYVADHANHTIRKVSAAGLVTTFAGLAGSPGGTDGLGSDARFNFPSSVAVDSAGNVYVADSHNHTIRKVTAAGMVTTLAGLAGSSGSADGMASTAGFNYPFGLAVDSVGNCYVGETGNHTIRKVSAAGVVTTLAGVALSDGNADGTAIAARFWQPHGVAVDNAGNLYVADAENHTIRKGVRALADRPVIDQAQGTVGAARQLDTAPQTGIAWHWSVVQRPAGSAADVSDATIRNPTFTPDLAGAYQFSLAVTNAGGQIGIRTLDFTAEALPSWNRIVFTRSIGAGSGIYAMNSDGSDVQLLTTSPGAWESTGANAKPIYCPTNRRIYFWSNRDGSADWANLYSMNPDGNGVTTLTTDDYRHVYYCVDDISATLYYLYNDGGVRRTDAMDLDGGNPRTLSWGNNKTPFDVNHLGQLLVEDGGVLKRVNRDGSDERILRTTGFGHPTWSPDGQTILFIDGWKLWRMNADGSSPMPIDLGGLDVSVAYPRFTPDGQKLLVAATIRVDAYAWDIYLANLDGSGLQNLTQTPSQDESHPFAFLGATQVPVNDLVAYYPLDGDAQDHSGNGNHGTAIGVTWAPDSLGLSNHAASFDGAGARIVVPDANSLDVTNLTVSAWVKLRSGSTDYQSFVTKWYRDGAADLSYALELSYRSLAPQLHLTLESGGDPSVVSSSSLELGAWALVTATYDGAALCSYVNGTLVGTQPATGNIRQGTAPLVIGGHDNASDRNPVDGWMDEVRVYRRALSAAEVQALFLERGGTARPEFVTQPQPQTNSVGATVTFTVQALGTAPLSYEWSKDGFILSDGGSLSGATNSELTITGVQLADAGGYSVVVANAYGSVTSHVAQLTVVLPNRPPTAQSQVVSTAEDAAVEITLLGADPDFDVLTFEVLTPPASGLLAGIPPNLAFTPATNEHGQVQFTFRARDGLTNSAPATVTINIAAVNDPPVLGALGNRAVSEGSVVSFTASATDPDLPAPTLTFSLQSDVPAGAAITTGGQFNWIPMEAQGPSTNLITVSVSDGETNGLGTFTIVVNEVNRPPAFVSLPDRSVTTESTLRWNLPGTDADIPTNRLSYSMVSGPAGMTVDAVSGELVWFAGAVFGDTTNSVTVRVTDDGVPSLSTDGTFRVTVNANAAPVGDVVADRTWDEGILQSLVVTAHDPDGPFEALRYSLEAGAPTGMTIDAVNGTLWWTPSEVQGPSTNSVTVRITDAGSPPASGTVAFTVVVREVNVAPTLEPVAFQSVDPLQTLIVSLRGSDTDEPANTLSYSLVSGPQGAMVDPVSGVFTWIPGAEQAGSTLAAIVQVADNGTPPMGATRTFPIQVSGCAPGAMRILVNGVCLGPDRHVTVTNAASLRIESTFARSVIFYTLDGQAPDESSPVFEDQVILTNVIVRARALDLDGSDMQDAGPVFVQVVRAYQLTALASGGGTIAVNPALAPSTNAMGVRYGPYPGGTSVELSALATAGWSFIHWDRAAVPGGAQPVWSLLLEADVEVEAVFGTRIVLTNIVNGSVRLNPSAELYPYGTAVRVTAEPAPGYYHRFWQGSGLPTTPIPLDLTLTNPEPRITAIFSRLATNQVTLSVLLAGPGSVTVDPLQNVYTNDQVVCVTAVSVLPSNPFLGWTGLTNSGASQVCVRLSGSQTNYTLTAQFSTNALPFWFSPAAYAVAESNGVVQLTVQREAASATSVGIRTAAGTALPLDAEGWGDYAATNGVLSFEAGAFSTAWNVALRDNHSHQSNRVFRVQLFDPAATNTVYATAEVTVVEDDAPSSDCSVLARKVEGGDVQTATLRGVLEPGLPEMKWRLGHEHVWRNSGEAVNLLAGDYDLRFKPVVGFEPPGWTTNGLATPTLRVEAGVNLLTNSYTAIAAVDMPNGLDVLLYPAEVRGLAQWRLVGEATWRSGERTNVAIGEHLLEFSTVDGYVAPLPQTVVVGPSGVQAIAVEYIPATVDQVVAHDLVELALADNSRYPYRFAGQIVGRKDTYGSGSAIKDKVVLTAAHVVYDNKALAHRAGVRWHHMGQGTGRDASLQPRGWVLWGSYSEAPGVTCTNQVAQEPVRGLATLRTRDVDVAALYFLSPAARGWHAGYLVSGATACATNQWLETTNSKMLVGFPNAGANFGRMMSLGPKTNALARMANADYTSQRVYGSTALRSFEGNSGAALCVDAGNGVYYPAAVYLGVTDDKGLYAAIDSEVVSMVINKADYLADTGRSHGGGSGGPPEGVAELPYLVLGELTVRLGPVGAEAGGARWSLVGLGGPYTNNHTIPFLSAGSYEVSFSAVMGYRTPTNRVVAVWPGQLAPLWVNYEPAVVVPAGIGAWLMTNGRLELTVTGGVGSAWVLEASTNLSDPMHYGFRPVQTNMLDASGQWFLSDTNLQQMSQHYFRLRQ